MDAYIDPIDQFISTGAIIYVLVAWPQTGKCPGKYPDMDLIGEFSHMPELAGLSGIKRPVADAAGLMTLPCIIKAGPCRRSPTEDQDSNLIFHRSTVCHRSPE
jgi:hypothetical protein